MKPSLEVLRARAEELARPARVGMADQAGRRVVVARSGAGRYAFPCEAVSAVAGRLLVTPVPGLGPPYRGVTAWQGQLLPVADLALLLGEASGEAGGALLLVTGLALLVDAVEEFMLAPEEGMAPLTQGHPWLRGVLASGALLVDPAALDADPRWEVGCG